MRHQAAPFWQLILSLIVGPPIMAFLWRLMSGGFASAVQGGSRSEETIRRQRAEFWILLIALYVIGFAVAAYAWLR
ncbi:MAG: hypothetical protein KGJ51_12560 [Acidobacteriota bacterium]|nr:hypothetical protein [Acidobacteriota bacterium]MDE3161685.1 hypothetical protein [Acidobacteriota bacterium]